MGRELWKVRFRDGRQCFPMVLWRHKVGNNVREDIYAMHASESNVPIFHFYTEEGQSDLSQIPDWLEKSIYCLY